MFFLNYLFRTINEMIMYCSWILSGLFIALAIRLFLARKIKEWFLHNLIFKGRLKYAKRWSVSKRHFTSTLKVSRSCKFYILRTLIPSRLGNSYLKIFDHVCFTHKHIFWNNTPYALTYCETRTHKRLNSDYVMSEQKLWSL